MAERRKLIIPGGSGFLGRILCRWFADKGWEVTVLSRRQARDGGPARVVSWDGATLGGWQRQLEGAEAVINLTGRSVNCRYHARNRQEILSSRLDSTRIIGRAIAACIQPPVVWLNSSTATIYKHSFERPMDEASGLLGGTPEAKDLFSVEVATAWEQALEEADTPATRKVALRIAMVLGVDAGGVYYVLRRLARRGLGGKMGSGKQFVSWIHEEDFCRAVEWLILHRDLSGPVNLAAPNPVENRELMRLVRQVCGIPFGLPASRPMLEIGAFFLRTETELILKSRRVVPGRLLNSGFEFHYPKLEQALEELELQKAGGAAKTGPSQSLPALPPQSQ
jgi:uncharacterized protein (TIGR01777 family)